MAFTKIFAEHASPRMSLPDGFITKYLKYNIPKNPIIQSSNGGYSWQVKLKKIGQSYCFTEGWSNVVKDVNLEYPDFLLFRLVGESTFKMSIYNTNGCERILSPRNNVDHDNDVLFIEDVNGGGGDDDDDDDGGDDDDDAVDPSFTTIISATHNYLLRLPKKFVGLPGITHEGTIPMKNLSGKEWQMGVLLDKSYWTERYILSRKWSNFRKRSKLSEGDKCVFKYIRRESKLCLAKVTKKKVPAS